jgi:hypothetical protein
LSSGKVVVFTGLRVDSGTVKLGYIIPPVSILKSISVSRAVNTSVITKINYILFFLIKNNFVMIRVDVIRKTIPGGSSVK